MTSKLKITLAFLGIIFLSAVFAACGSEAVEEPMPPAPARPAAPAGQPASLPSNSPPVEAPSMVRQQPAPADAPAAVAGVQRLVDINTMAMEAHSSREDSEGETASTEVSQTADVQKIVDSSIRSTTKASEDASEASDVALMTSVARSDTQSQAAQSAPQPVAGAAPTGAPLPPTGGALPPRPVSPPATDYGDGGYVPSPPPAYDTTFFQNYGVNPFIDARADHLSTFAMDVDTASYSVARRFVLDGNRPDPDSVRVEEFVNYFD